MSQVEQNTEMQRAFRAARLFLLDQLPATLLALSLQVEPDQKYIRLRAHFDEAPSEADIEAIQITATEAVSQYFDWNIEDDWELLARGQEPNMLPGGFAWRRGDPEPPVVKPGE